MDYNALLQKYNQILEENESLRRENERLRRLLSLKQEHKKDDKRFINAEVTQRSSSEAKISVFRSLFCGREDVFARRWHSKTNGKSGYQPVCGNEWVTGLCDSVAISVCPVPIESCCS